MHEKNSANRLDEAIEPSVARTDRQGSSGNRIDEDFTKLKERFDLLKKRLDGLHQEWNRVKKLPNPVLKRDSSLKVKANFFLN